MHNHSRTGSHVPMGNTSTNADTWKQFKAGSKEALTEIYNELSPFLYNYGCHLCADREVVKDIMQDFFLQLWEKRAGLPDHVKYIKSYLTTSFRRKIIDHFRKQSRLDEEAIDRQMGFDIILTAEQKLILSEEEKEIARHMQLLLNKLTKRQKEAIFLRFYQGLDNNKVAKSMDISVPAVYNIISKAIEILRMKSMPVKQTANTLIFSIPSRGD